MLLQLLQQTCLSLVFFIPHGSEYPTEGVLGPRCSVLNRGLAEAHGRAKDVVQWWSLGLACIRPQVPSEALEVGVGTQKAKTDPTFRDMESTCGRKIYVRN